MASGAPVMRVSARNSFGIDAWCGWLRRQLQQHRRRPMETVRDGAIVYDDIRAIADSQTGGSYRLVRRSDDALFGYAVGPQSWKRFLHPPVLSLWRAERGEQGPRVVPQSDRTQRDFAERFAFIGVRACGLRAIAIQDRVFLGGAYVDPHYRARREGLFVVALNCGTAGGTCFCVSMGSGPRASTGYDLALTEIPRGGTYAYLLETGTEAGEALLAELPRREATEEDVAAAKAAVEHARRAWGDRCGRTTCTSFCCAIWSTRAGARWRSVASPAATARWSVPPASVRAPRTRATLREPSCRGRAVARPSPCAREDGSRL